MSIKTDVVVFLDQNLGTGDAPCGNCGRHIWNIPVLLDSREDDGEGGYRWRVAGDATCLDCGMPLKWIRKAAPTTINIDLRNADVDVMADR